MILIDIFLYLKSNIEIHEIQGCKDVFYDFASFVIDIFKYT